MTSNAYVSNKEAGEILSKELLALTLRDRNEITEEIHGVSSMAVEETPELLIRSLSMLEEELQVMPESKKKYYTKALSLPDSYVQKDRFKLRFLRTCLFRPKEAAERIIKHLTNIAECFGEQCLQRPVCLDDFTKSEQRTMKKGGLQLLPYRDRAGRRILISFPTDHISGLTPDVRVKISLYLTSIVTTNGHVEDLETQRKGIVVIMWFDPEFKMGGGMTGSAVKRLKHQAPVRASAFHICAPKTLKFRFGRFLVTKSAVLPRIRLHLGSPMELLYTLNSFGIPSQNLPITNGGQIKTTYIIQWFKTRKIIESGNAESKIVVESPHSSDVVFKRGGGAVHNAGNSKFRSIIQKKYEEGDFTYKTQSALVDELQKELTLGGFRIVIWNEKLSRFVHSTDKKTIQSKVEYSIRSFREKDSQSVNRRTADVLLEHNKTSGAITRSLDFDVSSSRKRFKFIDGNMNANGINFYDCGSDSDSGREDFCNCTAQNLVKFHFD
ncbi:unnamed protein product [Pseudo-nitzschia multistriata]|uniref:CRAL-TRIO domain-containing protein n=1 Tax=Pseudo-nitzschia multistriata TaxID=183589 RepID=A0A448ZPQ5_9STRA|nr:unnamed protein product [Pseudo-nitzschia multistriata]